MDPVGYELGGWEARRVTIRKQGVARIGGKSPWTSGCEPLGAPLQDSVKK